MLPLFRRADTDAIGTWYKGDSVVFGNDCGNRFRSWINKKDAAEDVGEHPSICPGCTQFVDVQSP